MSYVLAFLMAGLSFLLNRAALRHVGAKAVITVSPAVEEALKTLPAFFLGADVLLTHALFGVIEAGYDGWTGGDNGPAAALLSVAGHGLFGLATTAVLFWGGSVFWALGGGIAAHLVWNVLVIRATA